MTAAESQVFTVKPVGSVLTQLPITVLSVLLSEMRTDNLYLFLDSVVGVGGQLRDNFVKLVLFVHLHGFQELNFDC